MSINQPMSRPVSEKWLNKYTLAWASWDWGQAAINAVMITFVFTVYLTSDLFGDKDHSSLVLSQALTVGGLAIAFLVPVTGLRADAAGRRKLWIVVNTLILVAICAACFFVYPNPAFLWFGAILIALMSVVSEFAGVNYNAVLNQISTKATVGKVSGFGWGMGYVGGILALALVLFGFVEPIVQWPGASSENSLNLRLIALFSAGWCLVFALPLFFIIPESPPASAVKIPLKDSYKVLFATIRNLWSSDRNLLFFLCSSAVFRDGLAAIFTFGGVIAAGTFGFAPSEVIIFAIAGNLVAALGAVLGGRLDDTLGPKKVICGSLAGLLVAGAGVFLSPGASGFWIFGLLLCLFVGPAQSASRSYLSRLVPAGREGELFGLYATTGRAVSFLAPGLFGLSIALATPFVASGSAQRFGILGILVVLALGLLLLLPIRSPRNPDA
ncbi:MFS transporter [Glutamicibacter halophytocola]|uniref:MFS transporter n=1 Tax=Glutamicibacter halophytocola TaxID=1933880 RepID=UPI0015587893|nr:MFS transporter [Glutamicibacter halophytocola]NQD41712.1 MFS transporter [Glutamicibacter halophytocola]